MTLAEMFGAEMVYRLYGQPFILSIEFISFFFSFRKAIDVSEKIKIHLLE